MVEAPSGEVQKAHRSRVGLVEYWQQARYTTTDSVNLASHADRVACCLCDVRREALASQEANIIERVIEDVVRIVVRQDVAKRMLKHASENFFFFSHKSLLECRKGFTPLNSDRQLLPPHVADDAIHLLLSGFAAGDAYTAPTELGW
jgi:hypothetical protein